MKFGKTSLWAFKKAMVAADKSRMSKFTIDDHFHKKIDIPYLSDTHELHKFDIYYADTNKRKHICVIYIHGGSYIFGSRKNAEYYKDVFLNQGFDFIAIDYRLNDGTMGVDDQINDCVKAINYIGNHKKELGIENDVFFLTGDSAGGHLTLYVTLLQDNKTLAKEVNIELNGQVFFEGLMINCPVYNFCTFAKRELLTESGQERMFGPNFKYEFYRNKYSPATYIRSLKTPLFFSTCHNDFLRDQSLNLKEDLILSNTHNYIFLDIYSLDKKVDHVHNVNWPDLPESKEVNNAMIEFIKKNAKHSHG